MAERRESRHPILLSKKCICLLELQEAFTYLIIINFAWFLSETHREEASTTGTESQENIFLFFYACQFPPIFSVTCNTVWLFLHRYMPADWSPCRNITMVVTGEESKLARILIITLVTGMNQITPQSPKLVFKSLIIQ